MKYKFGFIGAGNMGGALAVAVSKYDSAEIYVSDFDNEKAKNICDKTNGFNCDNTFIAENCYFIVLGVKPQIIEKVLNEISPILSARKDRFVLISMAASIEISKILNFLNSDYPVIRIMPNTPVFSGKGMVLYSASEKVTDTDIKVFSEALSNAGVLDRIDEKLIDAAGCLSGCGPAFVYMFAEALADGAVECGVPRDKAMLYAAQTLLGSAQMLIDTKKHPGELKDAVCSPGGTTIAGVHALEDGGLRANCMDAIKASYRRTLELK
ncbi:MAG: pyrroline-5-carboxylate reductase [Oscillospiraceae bacterium]|nr:pyrroline-5-carboxylate reductase [Oscillospiraceae bacterium]